MAGDLCPYCGTLLTTSLRFCVNCRRSVTEDKIKRGDEGRKQPEDGGADAGGRYRLARRTSYDGLRQARTFFITASTLLFISFVYYFVMKFVIHEPIPFEDQLSSLVQQLSGGSAQMPSGQEQQAQTFSTTDTARPQQALPMESSPQAVPAAQ